MRNGIEIIDGKKPCSKCKALLPIEDFHSKPDSSCGLASQCKKCLKEHRETESYKEAARLRYKRSYYKNLDKTRSLKRNNYKLQVERKGKDYVKSRSIKNSYKISLDDYNKMLLEQDNKCKTCNISFTDSVKPNVDHCHSTGRVRGLLCSSCNKALGFVKDNTETLNNLIKYLTE